MEVTELAAVAREFRSDVGAVLISLLLVGLYYAYRWRRIRLDPTYSIHGVNELARSLWVDNVMRSPGKDIMAVQTLRNFIMGASLMASTASLLIIGTLTLSGQAENIGRSWHLLNPGGSHSAELWIFKVMCLLVDFVVAFFSFVMSVRLANQVVFMLNAGGGDLHHDLSPPLVARRLNRAGSFFSIGLRCFLYAVPLAFWLFGPAFLMLAALGLVVVLLRIDRSSEAPD